MLTSPLASAVLALLVAGCATAVAVVPSETPEVRRQRFETAEARTRAERPMVEWVQVKPDQLQDVTPERLQAEAAAVIIMRGERALESGQRVGTPGLVNLRDLLSNTPREVVIQQTGGESEIGWGVAVLPPGKYVLNGGGVARRTVIYRNGLAGRQSVEAGGHAFVPMEKAIAVNGGDVLYIGTTVGIASSYSGRVYAIRVHDDHAAAARWMEANLPKLAPKLRTRLLTPLDHMN